MTKRTALFIFSDPVRNDVVEDFKKQNKGDGDALLQNGHPLKDFEFLVFMIVSEVLHSLKQNRETEDQVDEGKEDFVSHVIHDSQTNQISMTNFARSQQKKLQKVQFFLPDFKSHNPCF